jgi:GT2 family glycosyltransferase
MYPRVTVVILNWNGRRYLAPCLDALLGQTFQDSQIILVDNGSTDGSVELLRTAYPQAGLILNERNLGFAAANNQAIRASGSEFVATLNNDTRADPGWLGALVEAMDAHPGVGMCASKMLFADRPHVINSAGIAVDRAGIAWDCLGGQPDDPSETTLRPVFGPCAGAALYRRAMLDRVGLFDEDFFAYLGDVDLAWRGQLAGWQALYVPQARVYHHHSATGKEGSPFKNRLLGRNKVWLIAKNYPMPYLLAYLPVIVGLDLAAVGYALLARREWSALQGRIDGLRGLFEAFRKREPTRRGRDVWRTLAQVETPGQILKRYQHIRDTQSR